ncbi:DNA-binding WRKY domain-containing protein [Beauveria brongniartii RCEF 3172]|uniref:DNA-binding WRKY domain-containing protein n=1 Tax=Beauveria brongniartii RCEF 3172 TaxID=1081107 RepID=A0A167H1A5_9HYPO|nr:DNA-binding WRKY domain-containing protein [Beauveria brongniartii RCEF 3172]
MDGIDDSLLSLAVVRLADYTDRLTPNGPGATVVAVSLAIYYCLFASRGDAVLVAAAAALASPNALWHLLARYGQPAFCGVLAAACSVLFLRLIALTAPRLFSNDSVRWTESAGSFFVPSRTTHTRFFPKKHSFAYSYLTVGIPVGLRTEVNGILSIDPPLESAARGWWTWLKSPLYEVDGASHLARGRDAGGLREKLNRFLISQSIDPSDYPHAFLVTAPKFLGYSFNPVSFWYLYSPDKVMSAMILEVNNTFDERRPYLVFRDFDQEAKHIQPLDPRPSTNNVASRFSASFEKDFHVSPFNSRKGSYSVLAKDPLGPGLATFRSLDVTINLRSSKGHPKLVARLVHQTPAIDAAEMTALHKVFFVGRWFWIGFATFPRIVKEAAILFFRRSLHVWFRPEPLPQSLGRHATTTERRLEAVFRDYLRHRVEQSPKALRVCYIPSGISASTTEDVFASKAAATATTTSPAYDVEIRVLTPVFYARFVHYAHDFEGLFNELAESRTVAVDKPDMLPHIFLKKGALPLRASGLAEYAAFRLIQFLRRTPEPIRRPMTSAGDSLGGQASTRKLVDIRGFRISPMDAYVLEHGSDSLKSMYRSTVSRLFLADRFFLGSSELLSAVELICRAGFAYLLMSAFYH